MGQVTLIFARGGSIGGWLIRLLTWSRWSHVALVDGNTVIEARAFAGVVETPLAEFKQRYGDTEMVRLNHPDPLGMVHAVRGQLGKPYDYWAIAGFLFHRDWQRSHAWFCSELVAWASEDAGRPLFRRNALNRVTQEHLWLLPPPASEYF